MKHDLTYKKTPKSNGTSPLKMDNRKNLDM